uniref:CNNM transmembrane domain-containing protein n=1 Tax=Parastrongyloides trichosuri TaxID=131310 RepID=A0A0N4Z7H0_PARTI
MTELAVVSSRKSKLQSRAERGDRGARAALKLAEEPTQFLSAVQVGITLIGILAGAYGEPARPGALFADHRHRRGGGADHLCLADRRRAGAQASGPDLPGDHRLEDGRSDLDPGPGDEAVRAAADGLDFGHPEAAGRQGPRRVGRHPGRGGKHSGRGHVCGADRAGRAGDDRRDPASGRPGGARGHDAAPRGLLDRAGRFRRDAARGNPHLPLFAHRERPAGQPAHQWRVQRRDAGGRTGLHPPVDLGAEGAGDPEGIEGAHGLRRRRIRRL